MLKYQQCTGNSTHFEKQPLISLAPHICHAKYSQLHQVDGQQQQKVSGPNELMLNRVMKIHFSALGINDIKLISKCVLNSYPESTMELPEQVVKRDICLCCLS